MKSDKSTQKRFTHGQFLGALAALFLGIVTVAYAVTLPNTFTSGTAISSSQMNANFSALKVAVDALENVTRTVAYPALEFRGPGVDLGIPANFYSQSVTGTGNFLTAPLHLPVGAKLTEVKCTVGSPDLTNANLRIYQSSTGVACSSPTIANNGGAAVEFLATCNMPILSSNYYYIQVSNLTSSGLTLQGACYVTYQGG